MRADLGAEIAVTAHDELLGDLRAALGWERESPLRQGPMPSEEAATRPADWVMSAIVGAAGLVPGLRALEQGATLALANKESLVTAGSLIMGHGEGAWGPCLCRSTASIRRCFRGLVGEDFDAVERIIITASGGAFREWSLEEMAKATPPGAGVEPPRIGDNGPADHH